MSAKQMGGYADGCALSGEGSSNVSNPPLSYHCYLEDVSSIPGGAKNLFAVLIGKFVIRVCLVSKNLSILALPFTFDNCSIAKIVPIVISVILTN